MTSPELNQNDSPQSTQNDSPQPIDISKQRSISGGMRRPSISINMFNMFNKTSSKTNVTRQSSASSISMAKVNRNGGVVLYKRGTDSHQDLILNALMVCYVKNTMDTTSVASKLDELGLSCMVIEGDANFSFYGGRDALLWSKWDCTKYGIYTVITMQYREPLGLNELIKCSEKGSMNDDDREMVEAVLSECRRLETMKVKDIARAIKQRGTACVVLKESDDYHYYKKHEMRMSWSEWMVAGNGKYSVILLK